MDSVWGMILGGLTLVLSSTVITAYVTSRVGLKKLPLEERTSKADAAETITNSAIALSAAWETRFKEVMERVTNLETHSEQQDKEILTLRTHIERWVSWYHDFRRNWNELRLQENAPNPPNTEE